MALLAPEMMWGAAAAGVPIAIHFFFRSRWRRVPWAAMKFLLQAVEQTSRRLKFQELLLLAARVLVLVLLALALSRPSSFASGGGADGDAVDAVLVVDNSLTMGARDGEKTRFERARAAALAVIDRLPSHSTVQIITAGDRAVVRGPHSASDLDQARRVIGELTLSHQGGDLLPAATEAAALLKQGPSPNKELYVFSDMQKAGFDRQSAPLRERLKAISEGAAVHLVRCGTRRPRNAAIVGIAPQSGTIPHIGERVGFAVLVKNAGVEPVPNLTVTLEVDGKANEKDAQPIASLGPGETRTVTLTGRFAKPGLRTVTAVLKSDDLDADNRLDQVIPVADQIRVLVVDGSPDPREPDKSSAYYLMHALRPVGEPEWSRYHLQPRAVAASDAAASLLADKDLCILVNCAVGAAGAGGTRGERLSEEFVDRLGGFVREGKGLIIFGGPRVNAADYNRVLGVDQRLLPGKLLGVITAPAGGALRINPDTAEPQSFLSLFREEPLNRVGAVEVGRALDVQEEPSAGKNREAPRIGLRFDNGRPAVLHRRVGAGEVVLITVTADQTWSDWPLRHTFIPFIHTLLGRALHGRSEHHTVSAGKPVRFHPVGADAGTAFSVIAPDGKRTRLGVPKLDDGRPLVEVDDTPTAGIWRIVSGLSDRPTAGDQPEAGDEKKAGEGVPFAVVPDAEESENLESLTNSQIDERLGFSVVHLTAGLDAGAASADQRLKREWTMWILAAVLLLAMFEAGLAWWCGKAW